MFDVIIIGSGPAGLSAAVYGKRAGLSVLLIEKEFTGGGQIISTQEVDNYLGLPGIGGFELGMKFKEHAEQFHPEQVTAEVTEIRKTEEGFLVVTDKESYRGKYVIAATGARYRHLDVPGEKTFTGRGVSYCATCDGAFFRDKTVAVVGGGDVALEDALVLKRFCKKVYLIHRRNSFRAAAVLQKEVMEEEKIDILWNTTVEEIKGETKVTNLLIDTNGKKESLLVDGIFVAVGMVPNSELFLSLADTDEQGYLIADETCKTSCEGLLAAGDLRTKQLRQVITSVADGANAIASLKM